MIGLRLVIGICVLILLTGLTPAPRTFIIDTDSSSAAWRWHSGKEQHSGMMFISSGELLRDNTGIAGGTIRVDMNSLSVSTVRDLRQNSLITGWLKGPQFFDTYKHPVAVLRVVSVWHEQGNRYTLNGTLTVKDRSLPVRVPADIRLEKKRIEIAATLLVDQIEHVGNDSTATGFRLNLHIIGKRR